MADLEQKRRAVRVLELLDESYRAFACGDTAGCGLAVVAALSIDAVVVSAVQGGMIIGEIPRPEEYPYEWDEYVQANRDGLARMEEEERDGDASG